MGDDAYDRGDALLDAARGLGALPVFLLMAVSTGSAGCVDYRS